MKKLLVTGACGFLGRNVCQAEKHLHGGFDSIHLASAANLKSKTKSDVYFTRNDLNLNRAAEREGIIVL